MGSDVNGTNARISDSSALNITPVDGWVSKIPSMHDCCRMLMFQTISVTSLERRWGWGEADLEKIEASWEEKRDSRHKISIKNTTDSKAH